MEKLFEIIHEDAELLVINKAADLVCHPSKNGEMSSLIGRVRLYLGSEFHPHMVNRLDRETSGVTVVAKTAKAARDLHHLWQKRQVQKEYLAIVHGHVGEDSGLIDAPLGADEHSRVTIKDCVRQDGASSQTQYSVERRFTHAQEQFSLLRLQPLTGRKHQIRIHLAHIGHPVVGDKMYGRDEDAYLAMVQHRLTSEQRAVLILPNQALHAQEVRFKWRGQPSKFSCPPESWFVEFAAT